LLKIQGLLFYIDGDEMKSSFDKLFALFILATASNFAFGSATINLGDKITINATLNTTDPNENGEGEPLIVTVDDKTIGVIPNYAVASQVIYTAPSSAFVNPGSPAPTFNVSWHIQGADGDESATVSTTILKAGTVPPPDKSATEKNFYKYGGMTLTGLSAGFGVVAPYVPQYKWVGSVGAMLGVAGSGLSLLDPIDSNYKTVELPKPPVAPTLPANSPAAAIDLVQQGVTLIGLASAVQTSVNRASGAFADNQESYVTLQQTAMHTYIAQERDIVHNIALDLSKLDTFSGINLSTNDVLSFEQQLASSGLPEDWISTLKSLGLTDSQVATLTNQIYVQDVNAIAGTYPQKFMEFGAQLDTIAAIPEPETYALFLSGLLIILGASRNMGILSPA
jgi:hypothetical protein